MRRRRNPFQLLFIALLLISGVLLAQRTSSPAPPAANATTDFDMTFVKIEPGEFMMGCSPDDNACNADEKPSHRVRITKPFEIGKYEVTQKQWKAVAGSIPACIRDDHPVDYCKGEAQNFLNSMHAMMATVIACPRAGEYAARAGTKDLTPENWMRLRGMPEIRVMRVIPSGQKTQRLGHLRHGRQRQSGLRSLLRSLQQQPRRSGRARSRQGGPQGGQREGSGRRRAGSLRVESSSRDSGGGGPVDLEQGNAIDVHRR
jgi:hypothetical protein